MKNYMKESVLWAFVLVPYVYLSTVWNELPEKVPTHFNMEGVANQWSGKTSLVLVPGSMGLFVYLLMLVIPFLDPKKKIQQMGDKLVAFRFILTLFMSLLATYLLYVIKVGSLQNPLLLFGCIGLLFAVLGNYLQTLRPNYFMGIRTPWTLENENVWKSTHRIGGRIWIVGGFLMILLAFFIQNLKTYMVVFYVLTFIMVVIPVVFSYIRFKKEKNVSF